MQSTGLPRPTDVATYARCRDHWFWIGDKDFRSKSMFAFSVFLLSLAGGRRRLLRLEQIPWPVDHGVRLPALLLLRVGSEKD
jgi:hypothetical protein